MSSRPIRIPGRRLVLTKNKILTAQDNTKSAAEASRWLGVSFNTYKKWAKYYKIFDQHLNQEGIGIKKGYGRWIKSLDQILDGTKKYRMRAGYIKKRLLKDKWVEEECSSCGYNEIIIGKESVALRLDYVDGDVTNNTLENLRLLCPNCYLSHNGHMPSSERFYK